MPYSTTVSALDLSGGVANVRVTAGYAYNVVEAPEQKQGEVSADISATRFLSTTPFPFSYAGTLAPQPSPAWYIALWIQEIPRIANGTGWLFRSGGFTADPPTDPIEVILAPEQFVTHADIVNGIGTLPITAGSTTITAVTASIVGQNIMLAAKGTDTSLPPTVTFDYSALMELFANDAVLDTGPFTLKLINPALSFSAGGPGHGFEVALLNAVSGIIENRVTPRIKQVLTERINDGVLTSVATRLNRNNPMSMPPGVILSIRNIRAASNPADSLPAIGVLAALGAFGGVLNKFPALTTSSGTTCFVVTASAGPHSMEVMILTAWREQFLRPYRMGRFIIRSYEWLSPPLARAIRRSEWIRTRAQRFIVSPAARWASAQLRGRVGRSDHR
jgi:hypothetical protein